MSQSLTITPQQLPEAKDNVEFLDSSFFKFGASSRQLPTPAEVRAQSVGPKDKPVPVIFDHLNLLVKFGHRVTIAEAQCLWIIRRVLGDAVPVPELYGWKVDGSEVFIYMEYIQGQELRCRWDSLSISEKTDICNQLKRMITTLHQVHQPPSDQFIGSINRQSPLDYVFALMPAAGPFPSVKKFNDWLAWLPGRFLPDHIKYEDPWRPLLPDTGRITLTHGDLHQGNILISLTNPPQVIAIIDWGQAGWYPDYWEYCKAAYTSWYSGEWRNRWIPLFLAPRLEEHEAFSEYTMAIGAGLPNLVHDKFYKARNDGSLTYYPTQVSILCCDNLTFQLRYSPALAQKPKANKQDPTKKPFNPFLNPSPRLHVTELSATHYVVLNKFAVVPEHFIVATKEFKPQTDLLEEDDLGAAYACLAAYHAEGKELFGFFNSGQHSGASQPHRHIQFLPVDSMFEGLKSDEWKPLIDRLAIDPKPDLPFLYFSSPIPKDATPNIIHKAYLKMHDQACHAMRQLSHNAGGDLDRTTVVAGPSPISYNLGFTNKAIVLCPRAAEGLKISSESGELLGPVALNGTVLAGTLLVKSDAEWSTLQNDEKKLKDILSAIGIPQNHPVQHSL
ncbi:hypothetical protein B7463_g4532, partial [Scytalidium lignicola]